MTRILAALVLLLLHAEPCLAQELGRLFFTAEQRSALDARRKARVPDRPAAAPVAASPTTRLDGYVRRSGGPSTVFVDGQPLPEGSAEAPRIDTGRKDGRIPITVGDGTTRIPLKPGETLDRGSGEVRDGIGGGSISVGGRK